MHIKKTLLFTPGPVPIAPHLLALGSEQPPYNRTPEFSEFTREILKGLEHVFQTRGSVALLSASGTAAMEAAVLNLLNGSDKTLVINGGTFGERWCQLCRIHSIPFEEITLEAGRDLSIPRLQEKLSQGGFTALLINAHETSTGHLYDIEAIGKVAQSHDLLYVVDAISAIGADPFFMDDWQVDVAILSSQKAMALPPGLSFVALGERALARLSRTAPQSLYLNLQSYLENQDRGQMPYAPAIGLLIQLHRRLEDIAHIGLTNLCLDHRSRAISFRQALKDLPFQALPDRPSNAMTALVCSSMNAANLVDTLRNEYRIEVAPSGGRLKEKLFRVSHMGHQADADIKELVSSLKNIVRSKRELIQKK